MVYHGKVGYLAEVGFIAVSDHTAASLREVAEAVEVQMVRWRGLIPANIPLEWRIESGIFEVEESVSMRLVRDAAPALLKVCERIVDRLWRNTPDDTLREYFAVGYLNADIVLAARAAVRQAHGEVRKPEVT